jgi:hypothetical protein
MDKRVVYVPLISSCSSMLVQRVPISSTKCNHDRYEKLRKLGALQEAAPHDALDQVKRLRTRNAKTVWLLLLYLDGCCIFDFGKNCVTTLLCLVT